MVEPFCIGFEHAAFNAALIQAFLYAFPDDRCIFHGERSHLECVSGIMEQAAPDACRRVSWNEITVAARSWNTPAQFFHAWRIASTLYRNAGTRTRSVAYTACTELDLIALKEILGRRRQVVPACAVLHGVMRTSLLPTQKKFLPAYRGMRLMFRLRHPRGLRFLALGEPILADLRQILPLAAQHFSAIELPYIWKDYDLPGPVPGTPQPIFGYLGVSATAGFDIFLEIVQEARRNRIPAEFRMVGHVASPEHRSRLADLGVDAPATTLSSDDFTQRGRSITYALWTIPSGHYRLTASTSFLEALSLVKPGIHLRNPYLEYYFSRMGDIGHLCSSPGQILSKISRICSNFPTEHYLQQCQNIIANRKIFSPETVGLQLRAIVNEISGELST